MPPLDSTLVVKEAATPPSGGQLAEFVCRFELCPLTQHDTGLIPILVISFPSDVIYVVFLYGEAEAIFLVGLVIP